MSNLSGGEGSERARRGLGEGSERARRGLGEGSERVGGCLEHFVPSRPWQSGTPYPTSRAAHAF